MTPLKKLADLILQHEPSLTFTMLEIGGVPLAGEQEPFHILLELFPGSNVLAFEVDEDLCAELNKKSPTGLTFYATALGRTEETRPFYETNHPMCCSLYPPNEKLISLYNNFQVAYLKSVSEINTVSLDYFVAQQNIGAIDFIKIDIQGAELDVFEGAQTVLKQIVAMVCEVEFIPHYIDQPLFGDVCAFLSQKELMFHKFLGMGGRALSPIMVDNDANNATQHIWSDAVFITHIFKLPELSAHQLLKLAIFAYLYDSPDLTYHCFQYYDKQKNSNLTESFIGFMTKAK